jgi:hypothetical protein
LPATKPLTMGLIKIVAGGQTGADRGALDAARAAGVAIGGWIPLGRWAEDGSVPHVLEGMQETASADPAERTASNVEDSDATLIVTHGGLRGGTALTRAMAEQLGKPWLWIDLDVEPLEAAAAQVAAWIAARQIRVLNVAGPRASEDGRIYSRTFALVSIVLDRSR